MALVIGWQAFVSLDTTNFLMQKHLSVFQNWYNWWILAICQKPMKRASFSLYCCNLKKPTFLFSSESSNNLIQSGFSIKLFLSLTLRSKFFRTKAAFIYFSNIKHFIVLVQLDSHKYLCQLHSFFSLSVCLSHPQVAFLLHKKADSLICFGLELNLPKENLVWLT